jgi:hypothetical protein
MSATGPRPDTYKVVRATTVATAKRMSATTIARTICRACGFMR